jgi:pyruvate/2-oxoglutarate dehydrogenase complex dihydrolipoamide dehydrogenase (E3) component
MARSAAAPCRRLDSVFDAVFFATGRAPNSRRIGLEALGIGAGAQGHVQVDAWQTTSVPSVHAVGDIAGKVGLTPVAVAASRRLMDRCSAAARARWTMTTTRAWCSRIRRWARWA